MTPETIQLADFQAFACTSCGLCCTRQWNVIIEPEVEAGIRGSKFYERREREGYIPLEIEDGGRVTAHRQRNGDCMFLAEEVMCGLHSELGGRAKPVGCQLYPYRAVRTPSGTFFSLSFACPPVVAGLDRDVEANRVDLAEIMARFPDAAGEAGRVQVTLAHEVPWESYLQLEARLIEAYDRSRPMDSMLSLAACVSAATLNLTAVAGDGSNGMSSGTLRAPRLSPTESWPALNDSPLDNELMRSLLSDYLIGIISILENERDNAARSGYGYGLAGGERMPSSYFNGSLPGLDLDRSLPDWALEHCERYFLNAVVGKSILSPSVVSRLLAMAIGFAMLNLYAEAFRQMRQEEELSLQSLTLAFEVVEGDAVSHSSTMSRFFDDFEETLPKFLSL